MGQEIDETHFTPEHFHRFSRRLKEETALLKQWLQEGRFRDEPARIGLELEAWLVDDQGLPTPRNEEVIRQCNDPHLETELARYNLELNTDPVALPGRPFSELAGVLEQRWARLREAARGQQCQPTLVGILPSVREADLSVAAMSGLKRYQALNEQVLALRNRRPIHLDIRGEEHITLDHPDVMLESAATSLQLHLQVSPGNAHRLFNAAVAASAATVGTAANSPLLFDHLLWAETRIPLFEQAVAVTPCTVAMPAPWPGWASAAAMPGMPSTAGLWRTASTSRCCCRCSRTPRRRTWPTCGCTTAPSGAGTARWWNRTAGTTPTYALSTG